MAQFNSEGVHLRDIVVVGASAGGVEAIIEMIKGLPADFSAAMFIVLHMPSHGVTNLHHVISRKSLIPAVLAKDNMVIERGKIYCAQPDLHLILEKESIILRRGPRENHYRPAIDVLFRSAAFHFKERVIGVVLSGTLNDGTSGMWSVKAAGGLAIIQEPKDALFDSMPVSVKNHVELDHISPAKQLGPLLHQLTRSVATPDNRLTPAQKETLQKEIAIAKNKNALKMGLYQNRELTPFACPDCHGALVKIVEGNLIRFRCHTGHSYTADALLAGITENIENDLWQVMRGMEEGNMLLDTIGKELTAAGSILHAKKFFEQAEIILKKSQHIHNIVSQTDRMSTENIKRDEISNRK